MWEDEDDDTEGPGRGIDLLFPRIFPSLDSGLFDVQSGSLRPLFRLEVGDDDITIALDLPGVKKKDIEITCTEELVSVEAEIRKSVAMRFSGALSREIRFERYSKRISLPVRVDPNRARAKYRNGMVVVKLPILRTGKVIRIADSWSGADDEAGPVSKS